MDHGLNGFSRREQTPGKYRIRTLTSHFEQFILSNDLHPLEINTGHS